MDRPPPRLSAQVQAHPQKYRAALQVYLKEANARRAAAKLKLSSVTLLNYLHELGIMLPHGNRSNNIDRIYELNPQPWLMQLMKILDRAIRNQRPPAPPVQRVNGVIQYPFDILPSPSRVRALRSNYFLAQDELLVLYLYRRLQNVEAVAREIAQSTQASISVATVLNILKTLKVKPRLRGRSDATVDQINGIDRLDFLESRLTERLVRLQAQRRT